MAAAELGLSLPPGRAGWQRQPLPGAPRVAERGFPAVIADPAGRRQARPQRDFQGGSSLWGEGGVGAKVGPGDSQPRASSRRLVPFGT